MTARRPTIARAGPEDETAILDCMRTCFGVEPDPGRWRDLHLRNPAGPSIIAVARVGPEVVCHVALLLRRARAFGEAGLVADSIDAMTRPEWRRRGVKQEVAAELRRHARERGLLAVYGVSNSQSLPGVVKYEARRPVRAMPLMVRPLRPLRAALWLLRARLPGAAVPQDPPDCSAAGPAPAWPELRDTPVSWPGWALPAFDARHSALFREADGLPPIAFVRDHEQLTWRYPAASHARYLMRDVPRGDTLAASAVIRTTVLAGLRLVTLMEWAWQPEASREALALARDALAAARTAGAHAVLALAMPGTVQRRLLRRLGFVAIPPPLMPRTSILTVRPEREDGAAARWVDPSHWHLTFGDGLIL